MTNGLTSAKGTDCNKVKIGGLTELYGDPDLKIEKSYTIVLFPGGAVEISRTTEGDYWVHVAVKGSTPEDPPARVTTARVDARGRYCDELNAFIAKDLAKGDIDHIAFCIKPPKRKDQ